jgi:hypothetical protein
LQSNGMDVIRLIASSIWHTRMHAAWDRTEELRVSVPLMQTRLDVGH